MHKGVDIAREAPRLIVSATNEPLASIIVVQTYYTLGWAQKSICILGWATTYTFMIHYNLKASTYFQFNAFYLYSLKDH